MDSEQEGLIQTRVQPRIHCLEAGPDGQEAVFQDRSQHCLGLGKEPVDRDHAIHQSDPVGLRGVDHPAGEQKLERASLADQSRQPGCATVAGTDAELDFRLAEPGMLRRDPDVAGHGQLAPAPEGKAVDGCDDRLAASLQAAEHLLACRRSRLAFHRGLGGQLGDVGAGYKCLLPRPGEDHSPHRRVGLDPGDRISQLGDDRAVEGVELVGSIDRDPGDTVAELEQESSGHGGYGLWAGWPLQGARS